MRAHGTTEGRAWGRGARERGEGSARVELFNTFNTFEGLYRFFCPDVKERGSFLNGESGHPFDERSRSLVRRVNTLRNCPKSGGPRSAWIYRVEADL